MPAPRIITSVEDMSTRVNSSGTYNAAIVAALEKGPVDTAVKVSSQTDYLRKFTADEKISYLAENAVHEAYEFLKHQNGLYVVRCAHIEKENDEDTEIAKSASTMFKKASASTSNVTQSNRSGSGLDYATLKALAEDENGTNYPFEDDDVCLFYGKDVGAYTNKIAVAVITDQSIVKQEGAFVIRVYKNGVLVETHTCSLDPTLKDGYGNNCFIETVLQNSLYIRAAVKEENAKISSYGVNLTYRTTNILGNEVTKNISGFMLNHAEADDSIVQELNDNEALLEAKQNALATAQDNVRALDIEITEIAQEINTKTNLVTTLNNEIDALTEQLNQEEDEAERARITAEIQQKQDEINTLNSELVELDTTKTSKQNEKDALDTSVINLNDEISDLEEIVARLDKEVKEANPYYEPETGSKEFHYKGDLSDMTTLNNLTGMSDGDIYRVRIRDNEYRYYIWADEDELWKRFQIFKSKYCMKELDDAIHYIKDQTSYICTCDGILIDAYETPKQSNIIGKSTYDPTYLRGGNDGKEPTIKDRIRALKTLQNINDINIQLIMDGGFEDKEDKENTYTYKQAIVDICDIREDSCHAILSTPLNVEKDKSDPVGSMRQYRNYELNINNYSAELYTPHQKYYDEFNDRYLYLSPGPYVAALILENATERGWHWAVAGYNRGVVPSLDVATTFEPAIVDEFSDMQVNTIIKDPGAGNIIWDELTLWAQASDLQDAHISRYVNIYLRPRLKELLKSFLFEFNDEETRSLLVRKIDIFMQAQGRAIYSYRIVCDETNNLDDDIENNRLNCWLMIKPTKLAKEIRQKIILAPYAVSLESLEI